MSTKELQKALDKFPLQMEDCLNKVSKYWCEHMVDGVHYCCSQKVHCDWLKELRKSFSAFQREYDGQVHVYRKQLSDFNSKFLQSLSQYDGVTDDEIMLLASIEHDFRTFFGEVFSQKGSEASEHHFLTVGEACEKLKETSKETAQK